MSRRSRRELNHPLSSRVKVEARAPSYVGVLLLMIAVLMFGFSYALVPMYNKICKTFGVNGKSHGLALASVGPIDTSRTVKVQFVTSNYANNPSRLTPASKFLMVHPNENMHTTFSLKNAVKKPMVIRVVSSVSPGEAAKYFKTIKGFTMQLHNIKSRAVIKWPLAFYIDKHLPTGVHTVTVSYTTFESPTK